MFVSKKKAKYQQDNAYINGFNKGFNAGIADGDRVLRHAIVVVDKDHVHDAESLLPMVRCVVTPTQARKLNMSDVLSD
jgi:hypothetical protein